MARNYWMLVTNAEDFRITRKLDFRIQGLKVQHKRKIQRIEKGDRLLYYIGGVRHFAATATATSPYFEDPASEWSKESGDGCAFAVRIQPEMVLDEDQYIDAAQVAPRLDYVRRWTPEQWYMAFAQSYLHLLPKKDFMLMEEEMRKLKAGNHRRRTGPPAARSATQDRPMVPDERPPAPQSDV